MHSGRPFGGKGITCSLRETAMEALAGITYTSNVMSTFGSMALSVQAKEYTLRMDMHAQKAPVWNCEDGKLQMGIQGDPRQATFYYSLTSLTAEGMLVLNGKEHKVKGKAWFDRQRGTSRLTNPLTNWEWFSFRFFDQEEIMLFSFPRTGYFDGTYIREDGNHKRLNDYLIEPLDFITESTTGFKFSNGWRVTFKQKKEKEYWVKPIADGQLMWDIVLWSCCQTQEIKGSNS